MSSEPRSGPKDGNVPETDPDFTQPMTFSYMVGLYLAANAIRDLFLLIEGPDCTYMKTQFVQGNHDWFSTLTTVSGRHRIANTALHPDHLSGNREEHLRAQLSRMARDPEVPALALTSMPMAFVTGADYERLVREVAAATGKPIIQIPGKSLSGDWLDGYDEALLALASQIDVSGGSPESDTVAIVGYLHDRNEADHSANITELRRMLAALGLRLATVWLSGDSFERLGEVKDAGTIISLPYARRAARRLARQTGARLAELPVPFGLGASERWIREIGALFGREDRAEAFVQQELRRIVPRLEWVVPFLFQNRRMGYVGEPYLVAGLRELLETLGAELSTVIVTNRERHARHLPEDMGDAQVLVAPKMKTMLRHVMSRTGDDELHLLITHNMGIIGDLPILEFGFPSHFRHALYERPFLGFAGALAFVDSMATAMRMREVELAVREMREAGFGRPER